MFTEGTTLGGSVKKANNGTIYNTSTKTIPSVSVPKASSVPSSGSAGVNTAVSAPAASSGSSAASSYQQQLAAIYAQQQAAAQASAAAQRAAAENAYNNNRSALENAFNTKVGALKSNYDSTLGQLGNAYSSSKGAVESDAAKSLREAYINKMLSSKNLSQQLSAQGLSGGAAETTLAGLQNNYGNARNNINTTLNDNITSLENTYQGNLASALQAYNTNLANAQSERAQYMAQLESDLANLTASSYGNQYNNFSALSSDYMSALQNALATQQEYDYKETLANNKAAKVNTSQGASGDSAESNYSKWLSYAQKLMGGGSSADDVAAYLISNTDANNSTIQQILNQLAG